MKNKRLKIIILAIPVLLLIPLIAMQFTSEVSWSGFDFLVMGILLLGTGLVIDLVLRKVTQTKYRIILGIVILVTFFIIWAELAIGIFGAPFAGD